MNSCRTCLKTPTKKDISDLEKSITDDNRKSIEIMMFCLDIKVTEDTKITTKLCNNCYKKIITYYQFKILSLKNDAYLKSLNPPEQSADQKIFTIYEDENGIEYKNYLESDEFGPCVIENCNREIKIEVEIKKEDEQDSEINIKEEDTFADIELDEDVETGKYENVVDGTKEEDQNGEQQMFQCKACPKQFLSAGGRYKHYRTTHLGKKSKCHICNKEVVCLLVHKLRHHTPSGMRYSCATCARRFVSRALLDLHVLSHTKDYQFQCDICQKMFRSKSFLSKHIRQVHNKEKNHKCKQCSKAFFAKDKLKDHIMRSHTNDASDKKGQICGECGKSVMNLKGHLLSHRPKAERPRLACKACPKTFYSVGGRKKRYRTRHLGKRHECDICNRQVVSLSDHKKHVHGQGELRFSCVECGRRCVSRSMLDAHMVTHTRDYRHECGVCLKKFSKKAVLDRHKRAVHEKERSHHCEFCPKTYFNKYRLQDHLRSHTNERPYTCNECGLSFTSKMVLTKHIITHSDVRNYPCKLCSMSFKTSGNLSAHMISHTKEKRYPCLFCGVRFGRSDHRRRHQLTAHGREPDVKPDS